MSHPQLLTPERHLVAAKRGLALPVIVAICGSTRFMPAMTEADLQETAAGRIVVRPGCDMKEPHALWGDPKDAEDLKHRLDELHRAKIRLADEVLIVGDYIGDSTRSEIDYARALGKPIRYTHPSVDPYCASETNADAGVTVHPGIGEADKRDAQNGPEDDGPPVPRPPVPRW